MIRTLYNIFTFNEEKAKSGSLCIIVDSSYSSGLITAGNASFYGAGVATYSSTGGKFIITVDSKDYMFTHDGNPVNKTPSNYRLKIASVLETINTSGLAATGKIHRIVTRSSLGTISIANDEATDLTVLIDTLTARDNFAVLILNGMLSKANIDPTAIDSNVMSFYCRQAYEWAGSMMTAAANARGKFVDTQTTTALTNHTPVPIETLNSTTDKLLNNLLLLILKTTLTDSINVGTAQNPSYLDRHSLRISAPTIESDIATLAHNVSTLNTTLSSINNTLSSINSTLSNLSYLSYLSDLSDLSDIKTSLDTIADALEPGINSNETIWVKLSNIDRNVYEMHLDLVNINTTLGGNSSNNQSS